MSIHNKIKNVFATPFLFINFFKKTKLDNFVGGLIIGALFSLLVNLLTVRTQEIISKQRALEALEREITLHILDSRSIFEMESRIATASANNMPYVDDMIATRFSSRIWDNTEIYKYLLEIAPHSSGLIDVYYRVTVNTVNRHLDTNEKLFKNRYEKCTLEYELFTKGQPETKEYCLQVARDAVTVHAIWAEHIANNTSLVKAEFHPTKDRLSNFWLKMLLGDKTIEILK